jgi:phosphate transport system substrate-binding protein
MNFYGFRKKFIYAVLLLAGSLNGCSDNNEAPSSGETTSSGTINICVDESFKPVIDSQIKVFESQNPNAKINVQYKPEAECLRDLQNDSIRMVIVTRGLSDEEKNLMKERLQFAPTYGPIAFDAVAVIVNRQTPDSLFTMSDIRSMVKGTSGYKYKVVMDGTSATSTVRFVTDSLLKNEPMAKNVQGAPTSQEVIDYVAGNSDAIGLIGVSWIGNKDDPDQSTFLQKVNIAALECRGCTDGPYVKPYQYNIYTNRYPMIRPLYYILKENYNGLGSGFRNFLIYEKGQLIFKRAYLLPARMELSKQDVKISE